VAETAFDLTYEGDALATGRMPERTPPIYRCLLACAEYAPAWMTQ
jgi:hypothetical protein